MAPIADQDSSYKRGLVLGLTMAEIIVLILFILLLLLAAVVRDLESDLEKARSDGAALQDSVATLRERLEYFTGRFDNPQEVDDLFAELELAESLRGELTAAKAKIDALEAAHRKDEPARALAASLAKDGIAVDDERTSELLSNLIADVREIGRESGALVQASKLEAVRAGHRSIKETASTMENLRGQVKNLQRKFESSGRGLEWPPCWAEADSGKPEYIFDVALDPEGLIVRDKALPHRANEQAALPLSQIRYGRPLEEEEFLVVTRPLFEWSEAHNCRFFVLAYDLTPDSEKALYKNRMRVLETHFYKYEVRDDAF